MSGPWFPTYGENWEKPKGTRNFFVCERVCTILMVSFYLQIIYLFFFFSFYKKDLCNFNYAEYFKGRKMHYRNLYQSPDETQHFALSAVL